MTGTPLFHETARQLWVNGKLSRETVNRLMVPIPPKSWVLIDEYMVYRREVGCDYLIPNNPANLERNREILRQASDRLAQAAEALALVGKAGSTTFEGLNARLDRLG